MRGPCCDALNPLQRPTPRQLKNLGATGVRLVLFDDPQFFAYVEKLERAGLDVAVVAAGESFPTSDYVHHMAEYARRLPNVVLWLIGNEPSAADGSASSWVMSPTEYADFWNQAATVLKAVLPGSTAAIGGMLGPVGDWLKTTWPQLSPKPDAIDVHYPEVEAHLAGYEAYGVPLTVMEWCWAGRGVKRSDVVNWQRMIDRHATDSCWFTWSDAVVPGMGLVSAKGRHLKAYGDYRAALA